MEFEQLQLDIHEAVKVARRRKRQRWPDVPTLQDQCRECERPVSPGWRLCPAHVAEAMARATSAT